MQTRYQANPKVRERAIQEGQALARLSHENLVRVLEVGLHGDSVFFIAMERLRGRTLASLMQNEGRLSVAVALLIAQQISDGVHTLHLSNLVHRDLKPANVFVTHVDGKIRAKILDLGAVGFEHEHRDDHRCPVTQDHAEFETWIPVFHRHLSAALDAGGDDSPLVFATAVYLDSLPARLDTGYLLVQVALEGFCKALSESSGKSPSLVRKKEWRTFIDDHEPELRAFGVDTASADQFLEKLRNEAPRVRTSRLVENTFRSMGIELPEEVCIEIQERNTVAHIFVMSPDCS